MTANNVWEFMDKNFDLVGGGNPEIYETGRATIWVSDDDLEICVDGNRDLPLVGIRLSRIQELAVTRRAEGRWLAEYLTIYLKGKTKDYLNIRLN